MLWLFLTYCLSLPLYYRDTGIYRLFFCHCYKHVWLALNLCMFDLTNTTVLDAFYTYVSTVLAAESHSEHGFILNTYSFIC